MWLRVKTRGGGGKGFSSHPTDKASSYWRNLPLSPEIRKTSPSLESGQHKGNAVCCSFMWNSLLISLNFCHCVKIFVYVSGNIVSVSGQRF